MKRKFKIIDAREIASEAKLEALYEFLEENRHESQHIDWDMIEMQLDANESVYVAFLDNEVVGICSMGRAEDLFVLEKFRDKGFGSLLVKTVILELSYMRERFYAEVKSREYSLYKSLGFKPVFVDGVFSETVLFRNPVKVPGRQVA